jgi:NitT/TauT family transport system substrate-binding protein
VSLFLKRLGILALAGLGLAATNLAATNNAQAADLDYGKPGDPIHLIVGYQPYYSEAWSAAVINGPLNG